MPRVPNTGQAKPTIFSPDLLEKEPSQKNDRGPQPLIAQRQNNSLKTADREHVDQPQERQKTGQEQRSEDLGARGILAEVGFRVSGFRF